MTVTFGVPDGSQNARPTFDDTNFQFVGVGPRDLVNMPIPYKGLTFGTGANDAYPASSGNLDGFFFKAIYKVDGSGYGPSVNGADEPIGPGHGNDYFDFADNAQDQQVYMAWTGMTGVVSNAGDVDLTNDPGAFGSEAITGVMGNFKAWFPLSRVQETTFGSYTREALVTISKGRLKLAGSGDNVVGVVERTHAKKVLISINLKLLAAL